MKNITIKEVAEAAGVSISSVSRYMSDPKSIKPIAAVKVAQAIRELNYVPSTFAQNLRRGHSNTIGVIVPKLTGYFAIACTAINHFLQEYDYLMIICDTEYNPDQERFYINQLIKQGVAGIVLASSEQNEETVLQCLGGFEDLLYFVRPMPSTHFSSVNEGIISGGVAMAEALLNKGYKDFLLLSNSIHFKNHIRKSETIREVLLAHGIGEEHIAIVSDLTNDGKTIDVVEDYLKNPSENKCIIGLSPNITENATIALNILDAGDEVGIGGYVLDNYAKRFRRDIVSCVQNPYELGLKAGEIILKQVIGKNENHNNGHVKEYVIENKVIVPS